VISAPPCAPGHTRSATASDSRWAVQPTLARDCALLRGVAVLSCAGRGSVVPSEVERSWGVLWAHSARVRRSRSRRRLRGLQERSFDKEVSEPSPEPNYRSNESVSCRFENDSFRQKSLSLRPENAYGQALCTSYCRPRFLDCIGISPATVSQGCRLWLMETFLDSMPSTARRENRGPGATTSNADQQTPDPDTTSNADEQPPETGDRGSSRGAGARMSRESSYGNKSPKSTLSSVSEIRASALVLRSPGPNGVASSRSHARTRRNRKSSCAGSKQFLHPSTDIQVDARSLM